MRTIADDEKTKEKSKKKRGDGVHTIGEQEEGEDVRELKGMMVQMVVGQEQFKNEVFAMMEGKKKEREKEKLESEGGVVMGGEGKGGSG